MVPVATIIATAHISVSVVHPAVVADVPTPKSTVPAIAATIVSPVAGRPQRPNIRRGGPDSRDPVVACGSIRPVAGGPHVIWFRARRLFVFRQRRRRLRRVVGDLVVVLVALIGILLLRLILR